MNATRNTRGTGWEVPCIFVLCGTILAGALSAKNLGPSCGTYPGKAQEEILAHRNNLETRALEQLLRKLNGLSTSESSRGANRDIGDIALLEEDAGIVSRRNIFDQANKTIRFSWTNRAYRVTVEGNSYSPSEQNNGSVVEGLGDDDSRDFALPFEFNFYGVAYRRVFLNSDGNLSFEAGDGSSRERSLGRLLSGVPRIGAFFADIDPARAGTVSVLSQADRFVVTWLSVPEYTDFGIGPRNTFQLRLFPNGSIEFAYADVASSEAIVGLAPGRLSGGASVINFRSLTGNESFPAAVAERFRANDEIDTVTAAQRFFETHEDSYDYVAVYNALGISPGPGVIAFEVTVRNNRSGYGDTQVDFGQEYGSPRRLQALLNMGPLNQYPRDPNAILPQRASARDTPLTVLAHEAGHLFLAFASVRDPNNPTNPVLLGRQSAHWAFTFNSEASLLEGNRILDRGASVTPRFETVAVTEQYSPLDQYLMGLRPKEEVGPLFYVSASSIGTFFPPPPQVGRTFDGIRQDFSVDDLIAVHGRRTPDHSVSQRKFRFAIVLIVPRGVPLDPALVEQVDVYRRNFETFYVRATGQRAVAETTLRRNLEFSAWPAAGVVVGRGFEAQLRIERPLPTALNISLRAARALVGLPSVVAIPAGATSVRFRIRGLRAGVDDLQATAADSSFAVAEAKLQVLDGLRRLRLEILSGDPQTTQLVSGFLENPIVVRVTDENALPYPGLRLQAIPAGTGVVEPNTALSDFQGRVSLRWRPAAAPLNKLQITLEDVPAIEVSVTATALGRPFFTSQTLGNAASFAAGLTGLGLHTIFGANLATRPAATSFPWPTSFAGISVKVNGQAQPLVFVSESQINFYLRDVVSGSDAVVEVETPIGGSGPIRVPARPLLPGIFFNSSNGEAAAIRRAGFVEIYATGLGPVVSRDGLFWVVAPVEVLLNGSLLRNTFAGLAPGFLGLYQINAELPAALSGAQRLQLRVGGVSSNEVRLSIAP